MDFDLEVHLIELENAAMVLKNPLERNALKLSENVILNFQKSRLHYGFCLQILERTKDELLLFETTKLIKNAIIFEWNKISDEEKNQLRQTLLNNVTINNQLPLSVREKILQINSLIIKRKYIDDAGVEVTQLMSVIKNMIYSGHSDQQILACMMLLSILQEFNNTVKSDDVCLTFEEHFKAKKFFELKELLNVFLLILKPIEELLAVFQIENKSHFNLMKYFLQIMEVILGWGFLAPIIPKRLLYTRETMANINQTPHFCVSGTWKNIMLNGDTVKIFHFLYWHVRSHSELQPKAMTCLIQLSTLSGSVFISGGADSKFSYYCNYLNFFLEMLKSIEIQECEAFGFSLIIRKLLTIHDPSEAFVHLPESIATFLLEKMLQMTLSFCELAVKEDSFYSSNSNYIDAFQNILEAWLLFQDLTDFPRQQQIIDCTTMIFNKFVLTHLASHTKNDIENSLEMNEDEGIDRDNYKEQLIIIGFFGRLNLEHSLKCLASLLEEKVQKLYDHLSCLQPNSSFNSNCGSSLGLLFEDIHWILLISANVILMESQGETPMIPKEINEYSIEQFQKGNIDGNSTLNSFVNSTNMNQGNTDKCDNVIRIVSAVFRLSEIENNSFKSGLSYYLSPLTSSTVMWFLKWWATSYLYIDSSLYRPTSAIYEQVLGVEKEGSKWALNYMLGKICFNIHNYFNEIDVLEDSLDLFLDVVNPKNQKLQYIVNMQNFQTLILIKDVELDSKIKRTVYKGLVMASNVFKDQSERNNCLDHIMETILSKFEAISNELTENGENYQNTELRMRIVAFMEELSGIVEGANSKTYFYIYSTLNRVYVMLPDLMKLYHNYFEIVVGILRLLVETASVTLMTSDDNKDILQNFHDNTLSCLQIYFTNFNNTDENDLPDDVKLLTELLKKILVGNFMPSSETGCLGVAPKMGIFILSSLLPKIYPFLETFPSICASYFEGLNRFFDIIIEIEGELRNIPSELMNCILYTLRVGLTSFTSCSDVQSICLTIITNLGRSISTDTGNAIEFNLLIVQPFLKLLIEIIFSLDLLQYNKLECFGAIYTLSCCNAEYFYIVLHQLMEERRLTLKENITDLNTVELQQLRQYPFNFSRDQRSHFLGVFDKFIASLSSFYKN